MGCSSGSAGRVLADKAEFLVGNGRYRFDAPQVDPNTTGDYAPAGQVSGETRGWDDGAEPVPSAGR